MTSRYLDGRYARRHPDWHAADAPRKAGEILAILARLGWDVHHILDVGTGTGDVLHALRRRLDAQKRESTTFEGWDIAQDAIARAHPHPRVSFHTGDPFDAERTADLVLALDVVEHVADDVAMLHKLQRIAPRAIVRLPLDLSVLDVLRPSRLRFAREAYGHLHAYFADLALDRVRESGWTIAHHTWVRGPDARGSLFHQITGRVRDVGGRLAPEVTARWLGGFSLLVAMERQEPFQPL